MADEMNDEPHGKDILVQKNMLMTRENTFFLRDIKNKSHRWNHQYIVNQVLKIVLPRILERCNVDPDIPLDGLKIRL